MERLIACPSREGAGAINKRKAECHFWTYEQGGARPAFDYRKAVRHAFLDNPVAQRAVRIVAEGVGDAPIADTDPAMLALVRSSHGGQSLLEVLAAQLLLHGNAYVQVMRGSGSQPASLFALRPERVSVVQGPDGWPTGYHYRVDDAVREIPLEDEDGWPCLIHLKSFHPVDDHYGAGCLSAAEQAAGQSARYDGAWQRAAAVTTPTGGTTEDSEARAAIVELVAALQFSGILPTP